jgi:hypothetical protein
MKIRNGFVSNSSSSSFICDVCGDVESGMDMSASDFDMVECVNGHCFCNDHAKGLPETTPQMIRDNITSQIKNNKYSTAEDKKINLQELAEIADEDLEDFLSDNYSDNGVPACQCPICSMISLSDADGYAYLKKKYSLTNGQVLEYIRNDFKTYDEFEKYLRPSKKN